MVLVQFRVDQDLHGLHNSLQNPEIILRFYKRLWLEIVNSVTQGQEQTSIFVLWVFRGRNCYVMHELN